MFNEAGKKIQGFIKVIFVLGIIFLIAFSAFIFFGISVSPQLAQAGGSAAMVVGAIIAIIFFVFGLLSLWLTCLFYFAFGKIEECVEEQNALTKQLIDAVSNKI